MDPDGHHDNSFRPLFVFERPVLEDFVTRLARAWADVGDQR